MSIKTPRLELRPCEKAYVVALIDGDAAFEQAFGLRVAAGYLEFPEALPFMLNNADQDLCWGSYLYIHPSDKALIGMGGFKGSPTVDGMVEIGYGVANDYRNQGYATEAAQGLIQFAFEQTEVQKVWAHTLADDNASAHVLKKCGLTPIAEVDDPDDGRVFRWEIVRPAS